jgi:hypothetical protein
VTKNPKTTDSRQLQAKLQDIDTEVVVLHKTCWSSTCPFDLIQAVLSVAQSNTGHRCAEALSHLVQRMLPRGKLELPVASIPPPVSHSSFSCLLARSQKDDGVCSAVPRKHYRCCIPPFAYPDFGCKAQRSKASTHSALCREVIWRETETKPIASAVDAQWHQT